MGIIYEVNVSVHQKAIESYTELVKRHIQFITQLEGFDEAHWYIIDTQSISSQSGEDRESWVIHYHVQDQKYLDLYFNEHAPKLKKESEDFGDNIRIHRRILKLKTKIT